MQSPSQEIFNLTKEYFDAQEEYRMLSDQKKTSDGKVKSLGHKLWRKMEEVGLENFTHKDFGKIYLSGRPYCKIVDIDKATPFLKNLGIYDTIMYMTAHTGRLNEYITENYIEKGVMFPEMESGIFVSITPVIKKNKSKISSDMINSVEKWQIQGEGL